MRFWQWLVAAFAWLLARTRRRRSDGDSVGSGDADEPIVPAGTPERRAENVVLALLGIAALFALGFILVYAEFSPTAVPNELLGLCMGLALVFIGAALTIAAKRLVVTEELEDDYPQENPEQQREIAEIIHQSGSRITRKRLLLGAGAATGGALGLAALSPVLSLGPVWDTAPLDRTPWHRGVRVVDVDSNPIPAASIEQRTFYTGFPEGADFDQIAAPLVIVRLDPSKLDASGGSDRLGAGGDPRLFEDLHARRLRGRVVSQADLPGARAQQRARLPVPLLDLRPLLRRHRDLWPRGPTAAAASVDDRRGREPAGGGNFSGRVGPSWWAVRERPE